MLSSWNNRTQIGLLLWFFKSAKQKNIENEELSKIKFPQSNILKLKISNRVNLMIKFLVCI